MTVPITNFIFDNPIINTFPTSLLVLGTSHSIDIFCDEVVSLDKQYNYQYIIVSGYKGEAQTIAHNLEDLGIPKAKLLLEHYASNTLENFLLSLPIIKDKAIQNLHILGKLYAIPRIKLTANKYLIDFESISVIPVDLHGVDAQSWRAHDTFLQSIYHELVKLKRYAEKGDIAPYHNYISDEDYNLFIDFADSKKV